MSYPEETTSRTYYLAVFGLPLPYPMRARELMLLLVALCAALYASLVVGGWLGRLIMPEPTLFRLVPVLIALVLSLKVVEWLFRRFTPADADRRRCDAVS